MTLNPQIRIADGVTVPYEGQTVDASAAVLARHAAELKAERERKAKIEERWRTDVDLEAVNPESTWQRIASWLA